MVVCGGASVPQARGTARIHEGRATMTMSARSPTAEARILGFSILGTWRPGLALQLNATTRLCDAGVYFEARQPYTSSRLRRAPCSIRCRDLEPWSAIKCVCVYILAAVSHQLPASTRPAFSRLGRSNTKHVPASMDVCRGTCSLLLMTASGRDTYVLGVRRWTLQRDGSTNTSVFEREVGDVRRHVTPPRDRDSDTPAHCKGGTLSFCVFRLPLSPIDSSPTPRTRSHMTRTSRTRIGHT
ncbi:hypothetical protein BDN71DRAFT_1164805 [Pleurotus eryngii]|uniref:Uncharacterized protein n=1 Tax=Pleurotus eryngii TaxID=5323 RepID=A0A9P5ZRC6_PLEER|nr:hypothetical protein BDN71DRAFT_1164805 [Pleurotus eryngii]